MKRIVFALLLLFSVPLAAQELKPVHGIAMHGDLKYPANFKHFDYVNPDAPKGGKVRLHDIGTFDSFNPYIVKGIPPGGITLLFDTLLVPSADEAFSEYGRIAESVEMPEDRSFVIFNMRKEARFHDGRPITADDAIFSLETLRAKGSPAMRMYYKNVEKAEKLGPLKVKFTFQKGALNRELPLIVGQMPILSKAYWSGKEFDNTTLEPPIGSGPYRIEKFEAGRYVVYKRDPNYWGKDLPVCKGQYNFDRLRYDFYRDSTVALEAFKAGEYDFRAENSSKKWAVEYDFPALTQGLVHKESMKNQRPTGMQGFVFNLRRPMFADHRVREALALAFDFEWSNKNLFYGQYSRTNSYFANSELAAKGLPSKAELKILEPFKGQIPAEVFTKEFKSPVTDGTGNPRENLRRALALLREAGYEVNKDRRLADKKTGKPFVFEILLSEPTWERIALPYVRNLEKLGISASVRTIDTAQYKQREDAYDYDMIVTVWGQSESPGNEQRNYWTSTVADMPGSRNFIGLKDMAVDKLVEELIATPDRESLVAHARALDRVLVWGHYVVPHWHITYDRVAFWDKFGLPKTLPKQGYQFLAWWVNQAKSDSLTARRKNGKEAEKE
jgi:microcin C transport system substrate-binding protein